MRLKPVFFYVQGTVKGKVWWRSNEMVRTGTSMWHNMTETFFPQGVKSEEDTYAGFNYRNALLSSNAN